MEQLPLITPKLTALHLLVEEQITPWTYMPFHEPLEHAGVCYSKGIWSLADASGLTQSKGENGISGTPLRGMPWTTTIPSENTLVIIDIKVIFSSMSLHPDDCEKFVFSISSLNFSQPE